jgi:hypothetical protein
MTERALVTIRQLSYSPPREYDNWDRDYGPWRPVFALVASQLYTRRRDNLQNDRFEPKEEFTIHASRSMYHHSLTEPVYSPKNNSHACATIFTISK